MYLYIYRNTIHQCPTLLYHAQIVRDGKNEILGLYPLLPENIEIDRDPTHELWKAFSQTRSTKAVHYSKRNLPWIS